MKSNEIIRTGHRIKINIPPSEGDVAIVPVDGNGSLSEIANTVIEEYGYKNIDLPRREDFIKGQFLSISQKGKKPVLFVRTAASRNENFSLEENLFHTLAEFRGWFRERTLWIPLMGTGIEGFTLEESFEMTLRAVNRFLDQFPTQTTILVSVPENSAGRNLINNIYGPYNSDEKEAVDFVSSLKVVFYVVGTIWDREEQLNRFIEEGIWEKGHEDQTYSSIINGVKVKDVLFAKSTYAKDGESILQVKAIGVVSKNNDDGASLEVDWKIKDLKTIVPGLGYYRSTIAPADFNDVVQIFSLIDHTLWQRLLPPSTTPPVASNKIAGLLSDADRGTDYLNISKDITAFARVIAAKSFEPPLAIALFGKWGSGKSFFMRKLREQIEDFSKRNANDMYCEGVVHIHFNAWSYMDANLWASFVSKIFEGLNEYITDNSLSAQAKKEIEAELNSSLNIAKEEMQLLEGKKNAIQQQIILLEAKRVTIKNELEAKIRKLQTQTAWDIINKADEEFKAKEKIIESLRNNPTYVKTENELREIIPEKYWNDPSEAYKQISSKYTFLKEFFRHGKAWKNLLWITLILAITILIPILLELLSKQISKTNFLIPQAGLSVLVMLGAGWRRAEVVYSKLQPVIASFWNIKGDYEKKRGEALAKFEQEEKALKLEIEKGKEELLSVNEQLQKAQTIKADIEFKMNNAIATEALYSFIEKRSKSDDYKRHLGIISIIRRDFEILNGLFSDHHQEIVNPQKASEFRNKFKKPLQRIILYIDDLDRCPEENVVQVLEAVNLLMAFPLFIVIVGVDPRWVKNALIKKYALQFTGKMNGAYEVEPGVDLVEPSNYLEKIFQVPFHLKDAPQQSVREMIRQLSISKPIIKTSQQTETSQTTIDLQQTLGENNKKLSDEKTVEVNEAATANDETTATIQENIELLELSTQEIEAMQDMGEIIGPNPRALKRFVNIYKIIKAHEEYSVTLNSPKEDLLAVLFLLSLSAGRYKKLAPSVEEFIQDPLGPELKLSAYFHSVIVDDDLKTLKQTLNIALSDKDSFNIIQATSAKVFNKHNEFIKRFTFKNI